MTSEIFKNFRLNPRTERLRAKAHARDKVTPEMQDKCPHPIAAVMQFVDDHDGRISTPSLANLFRCEVCKAILFLVDGSGKEAKDDPNFH